MDETSADGYVNDTIGRSDFAVVSFPSYGYVADPQGNGQGKLKLVPMTGMIHGREARIAADYSGYHKAEAGIDATLPKILKLPTGEKILNEEYLNPLGINVIKKVKGNFVLWGDRSLWTDTNWKWKHQRELMCYYENVLKENFDWIVFQINETATEKLAITSLRGFLYPEFVKGALRGNKFEDACQIKIDSELNTDAVRAAGDMYAQIMLRFGDVVERFIIRMGRQGIFEAVG
jgi:phage tail sheath protein FI